MAIRPLSLAILTLLVLLLPEAASASTTTRIIVKREPGLSAAERADIRADAGVRLVESLPLPRTEVVVAATGQMHDALRRLNSDPDVDYAEADRLVYAATDPEIDDLWGFELMEVPPAWDTATGRGISPGVGRTVAVVDSGVDDAHPELVGRVLPGYDWVDDDPDADDMFGHGTHVAGTIAANRDHDGLPGVAGVAYEARILPLRVLDSTGRGFLSDTIKAYDFAADRGVRIVNASLTGQGANQAERDAIERHPNVLFVVPAGNGEGGPDDAGDDNDDPSLANYPCAYALPNVLCVGASTPSDEPAAFSDFGSTTVDVFAPGTGIKTTGLGGGFDSAEGTSIAAPHVTGIAALLMSATPGLAPNAVIDAIVTWADKTPRGPFTGLSVSDGRANARRALEDNDVDGDGFVDIADNCPLAWNPLQEDDDGDGYGNACVAPAADADGDGLVPPEDRCPDEAASYDSDGCPGVGPDADQDGWPDIFDNCQLNANASQANTDFPDDAVGDACDPTPRGHDDDGDGRPRVDDACPNVYGTLANGCPAPPPAPAPPPNSDGDNRIDALDRCPVEYAISNDGCPLAEVASLSAKARKRGRKRSATIKVAATRLALLTITVERKKGRRWVRVTRRTVNGTGTTLRLSRLRRGSHRVRVSILSGAGDGRSVSKSFRVR